MDTQEWYNGGIMWCKELEYIMLSKKKECGANEWISVMYAGEKVQVDVKYVITKRLDS